MPYVSLQSNRYIGEHDCKRYHYGNHAMVRDCCVDDARKAKAMVLRNALTTSHPAYVLFCDAWNALTDAERPLVGDIVRESGIANGFKDKP